MSDDNSNSDGQDDRDEYKINTVIAARRAFERSEERDREHNNPEGGGRRHTVRNYESPGLKYCPCCKDRVSTAILLCNSGLMTVTSQIGVICTIYVATQGLNVAPAGLVVIFLLTCFAISIFGLCGIIGPIRKTYSVPQLQGAQKASSNFCILSYMVANLVVLFIFFVALCVCLSFLTLSAALRELDAVAFRELRHHEIEDLDSIGQWVMNFVTQPDFREDWLDFQTMSECCGFSNETVFNATTMPEDCASDDANVTMPVYPGCYTALAHTLWDNLNLMSGIMAFLFLQQLMASCAACQLLCCAQGRNQFSDAADVAVQKLGIAMETAREEVREGEVLLDSDYTSTDDDDDEDEDGGGGGGGGSDRRHSGCGTSDLDAPESGSDSGFHGGDYNITQRSSGPDSSDEEKARRNEQIRAVQRGQRQHRRLGRGSRSPVAGGGARAATYAQEMVEVVVESEDDEDGGGDGVHDEDGLGDDRSIGSESGSAQSV